MKLVSNYIELHGCKTVQEIIYRWAPPIENESSDYVRAVCRETGFSARTPIQPDDRTQMTALIAAMSRVENGVPASMAEVEDGWALLQNK